MLCQQFARAREVAWGESSQAGGGRDEEESERYDQQPHEEVLMEIQGKKTRPT